MILFLIILLIIVSVNPVSAQVLPKPVSTVQAEGLYEGPFQTKQNNLGLPVNAYRITITPTEGLIEYQNEQGLFYARQTLLQLQRQYGMAIPCQTITDYPAYPWRGLMLDVSRHFYSLEYLKETIKLLGYYKMNKLHLHLTDDEGWRVEIKSLPELTQKSAWRDMDRHDSTVIRRTLTEPRIKLDPRFLQQVDGRMRYGGFYTHEEIRELVDFAKQYHVDIVPEIDMPGHMMAAILAYPELCSTGKPGWGKIFSEPLCPAKDEVFTFIYKVLDEILELFPSEYIHIGADEVDKTTWKQNAACQALMKEKGLKDENELQSWFVQQVSSYIKEHGRKVTVWDDALEGGLTTDHQVMYWRDWKANIPYESIESEHPTLFCPGTPMYLSRRDSAMYDIYHLRSLQELTIKRPDLVRGVQANVWGEQVGNSNWANLLIWPRLLAVAEIGWTPYNQRNWEDFKRRAKIQKEHLKGLGMDLAQESPFLTVVQTPDTEAKGIRFHFEHEKIEPTLHYTLDGTEPSLKSKKITNQLLVKGPAQLSVGILENGEILRPIFTRPVDYHKAVGKKVTYLQSWNKAYPAAGETSLTNGLQGSDYYKDVNWQGFTGDMEVVIDMGENTALKEMTIRFMQISEEDVLIPGFLEVSTSNDGVNFTPFKRQENDVPTQTRGLYWKNFKLSLKGANSRYLKVLAKNVHDGQFIFTDEIIIH